MCFIEMSLPKFYQAAASTLASLFPQAERKINFILNPQRRSSTAITRVRILDNVESIQRGTDEGASLPEGKSGRSAKRPMDRFESWQ